MDFDSETVLPAVNETEQIPSKLLGSWTTQIGQQDQAGTNIRMYSIDCTVD